jgi:rubrerythrin
MADNKKALIDILNKGMQIEYASIWHYPQLARRIADKEAARVFSQLGQDSVQHASQTARMIRTLGGAPEENLLASLKEADEGDILAILRNMLEQEKTAASLYKEAADMSGDYSTRTWLLEQVKEEQGHAAAVQEIIQRLEAK